METEAVGTPVWSIFRYYKILDNYMVFIFLAVSRIPIYYQSFDFIKNVIQEHKKKQKLE